MSVSSSLDRCISVFGDCIRCRELVGVCSIHVLSMWVVDDFSVLPGLAKIGMVWVARMDAVVWL